jgi:hypothetical protein
VDEPDWFRDELATDVPDEERARLWSVADALIDARAYPRAAFRAWLRQLLAAAQRPAGAYERPPALWARVISLALPAVVLLCVVAIGIAGAGPFAT